MPLFLQIFQPLEGKPRITSYNVCYTKLLRRSLENRIPILASNVRNQKFGGHSMIIDLVEKDKVMIPKITTIQNEGMILKQFDLKKYERNRKNRFLDSRKFY